jgi:hypothetical protein
MFCRGASSGLAIHHLRVMEEIFHVSSGLPAACAVCALHGS